MRQVVEIVSYHFFAVIHSIVQQTSRSQLISTSSTRLLIEGFHWLGNIKMANHPDILSIYALEGISAKCSDWQYFLIMELEIIHTQILIIYGKIWIPSWRNTTSPTAVNAPELHPPNPVTKSINSNLSLIVKRNCFWTLRQYERVF